MPHRNSPGRHGKWCDQLLLRLSTEKERSSSASCLASAKKPTLGMAEARKMRDAKAFNSFGVAALAFQRSMHWRAILLMRAAPARPHPERVKPLGGFLRFATIADCREAG